MLRIPASRFSASGLQEQSEQQEDSSHQDDAHNDSFGSNEQISSKDGENTPLILIHQFPSLPDELQLYTYTYLPLPSLMNLQLSNRKTYSLLTYNQGAALLWRHHLNGYGIVLVPEREGSDDHDLDNKGWRVASSHTATTITLLSDPLSAPWINRTIFGVNPSVVHLKKLAHFIASFAALHEPDQVYHNDELFLIESIIATEIDSSSHDSANQDISMTRSLDMDSFYSSTGSDSTDGNEWLTFYLKNPAVTSDDSSPPPINAQCKHTIGAVFLKRIAIRPFMAYWQSNNIYPPKFVSIQVIDARDQSILYESQTFPVQHDRHLQVFELNPPVIIFEKDPQEMEIPDIEGRGEHRLTFHPTDVTQADVDSARQQWDEEEEEELVHLIVSHVLRRKQQALARHLSLRRQNSPLILKVNLLGKVQTQPGDELFYTCLNLFDVQGARCCIEVGDEARSVIQQTRG